LVEGSLEDKRDTPKELRVKGYASTEREET